MPRTRSQTSRMSSAPSYASHWWSAVATPKRNSGENGGYLLLTLTCRKVAPFRSQTSLMKWNSRAAVEAALWMETIQRPAHSYSPREFEREARRIDALTFETLALSAGESVVFCGFTGNADYIRRAIQIGCKVSVIEARESIIRENADLPVRTIRGSTSVIPARENAFDIAVAVGYLHEVDPSFHSQIIAELGRVARRVAIVELAPPSDPLGRRIAALYSRAKREFGSFEHYQGIDYWKKLLAIVKVEISQSIF